MWLADLLVAKGAKRGVDRQKLATDAGVTDEDIARAIDGLLGPGWQRSTAIKSDRPLIHVMVWENTGR